MFGPVKTPATLALLLLAAAAHATPRTVVVYVFNYDYSQNHPTQPLPPNPPPDDPTIYVGDTIRWQRISGTHDVRGCAGTPEQFASPYLTSGNPTYSHTYTHAGHFEYYCTLHGFDIGGNFAGGMAGYVDVLPLPCAADLGGPGGQPGADGTLNNNDFIAFIELFFSASAAADVGKTGGIAGPDGVFDNNDFVVYVNLFFAGC